MHTRTHLLPLPIFLDKDGPVGGDGWFWMPAAEFFALFNTAYTVRRLPDTWHQIQLDGAWVGATAGGPPALGSLVNGTFCCNPQYRVSAKRKGQAILHLSVRDPNLAPRVMEVGDEPRGVIRPPRFELVVLQCEAHDYSRKFLSSPRDMVAHVAGDGRSLDLVVKFEVHEDRAYVAVPFTSQPGVEDAFVLRCFCSGPLEIEQLPAPYHLTITGNWDATSAGGGPEEPTWGSNPQFMFSVPQTTKIMLHLEPCEANKPSQVLDDHEEEAGYGSTALALASGSNGGTGPRNSGTNEALGTPIASGAASPVPLPHSDSRGSNPAATATRNSTNSLGSLHGTRPLGEPGSVPMTPPGNPHEAPVAREMALFVVRPGLTTDGIGRRLFITSPQDEEVLSSSPFVRMSQQAALSLLVTGGVPLAVVPTIRAPGLESRFKMNVFSQAPVTVLEMPKVKTVTLRGEWTQARSGGCDLGKTFRKNPIFMVTVRGKARLRVSVQKLGRHARSDKGIDRMIGYYVYEARPVSRGREGVTLAEFFGRRVFESPFVPTESVSDGRSLGGPVVLATCMSHLPKPCDPSRFQRSMWAVRLGARLHT